ncbi:MAG: hypothetical protein ACFCUU_10790 [Cyclobacteriaceae bacterium]
MKKNKHKPDRSSKVSEEFLLNIIAEGLKKNKGKEVIKRFLRLKYHVYVSDSTLNDFIVPYYSPVF